MRQTKKWGGGLVYTIVYTIYRATIHTSLYNIQGNYPRISKKFKYLIVNARFCKF